MSSRKAISEGPDDPDAVDIFLIGARAVGDAIRGDVLAKLSRYESRLSHRYFKALAHLRQIQDRRTPAAAGNPEYPPSAPSQSPDPEAPPAGGPGASPQNGRTNPIPALPLSSGGPRPSGLQAERLTFPSPGRPFPNAHPGFPLPALPFSTGRVAPPAGLARSLGHAHPSSRRYSHPNSRPDSRPNSWPNSYNPNSNSPNSYIA